MLYVRFRLKDRAAYGLLEGDVIKPIEGDILGDHRVLDGQVKAADARLLAPVVPRKILAAAVNYQSHVATGRAVLKDDEAPSIPQLFLKPSSSVIGPGETIVLPSEARRVDAEGELVAIIGRACRNVPPEQALEYVFGYTCGNDVSARHWQRDDVQWWRAKGADTFSPMGPAIATGLDPSDLQLRTRVNGEERQSSSTSALIHDTAALISFASRVMTLEPGDAVFTGTPGETPRLEDGDTVDVEIEGIGTLSNPVRREG
jgi:2-keto-4-pentenoate hydratase/2-oxohepta-3-ene-1,7-dioic acid hydratase in catechol pathway